jgi:hypothetical protein
LAVSRGEGGQVENRLVESYEGVEVTLRGGHLEVVPPNCPLTPASGMHFFMQEIGSTVPESHLTGSSEARSKFLDASRLLELEKKAGITFMVNEGEVVKRLVNMEEVDVANKVIWERSGVDQ